MLKLIPAVRSIKITQGRFFDFNTVCLGENLLSKNAEDDFLKFCALERGEENIIFKINRKMREEEYSLSIDQKITVTASSAAGQLYALQSLKQIIFQSDSKLPCLEINDYPEYSVRGFMLDSGRYFFSVSDVKKIIKRMALHKLNFFHFHLTEDQGWRVQIDKYPLLCEKGSKRRRTNFDFKPQGGYYTKADIKEIVDFAHDFSIKVMPEFDIPGHSRAAIACYKNLSCFERDLPVADHWGVKHDVLCVGKDETMTFVRDVLDEFFEMFPDKYIHIGGDEVPKHRWNLCPECTKKRRELGLGDSDELQFWFMNEVKNYCVSHGRQTFMWSWDLKNDKLLDSDLGFTKCGDIDTKDRPFIDTSTSAYYIDLPYGRISLDSTADHKPYSGNCLGVEATLWSEYVPDLKKGDYMSFPRIGAMCETAWHGSCGSASFREKLDYYYSYLDKNSIGYATPTAANPDKIHGFAQVMWFERRQLAWEGLHNIFDDKAVERLARENVSK